MSLWTELDKLKSATWVELSHPLTDDSPYWAGIPAGSVELCRTVFDYDEEMLSCRIHQNLALGGNQVLVGGYHLLSRPVPPAPRHTAPPTW